MAPLPIDVPVGKCAAQSAVQLVYFEQEHPPGCERQMDFTHCGELGVTIGGRPFVYLLFPFVLSHSAGAILRHASGRGSRRW